MADCTDALRQPRLDAGDPATVTETLDNRYAELLAAIREHMGSGVVNELDVLIGERMCEDQQRVARMQAPEVVRARRFELVDDAGSVLWAIGNGDEDTVASGDLE